MKVAVCALAILAASKVIAQVAPVREAVQRKWAQVESAAVAGARSTANAAGRLSSAARGPQGRRWTRRVLPIVAGILAVVLIGKTASRRGGSGVDSSSGSREGGLQKAWGDVLATGGRAADRAAQVAGAAATATASTAVHVLSETSDTAKGAAGAVKRAATHAAGDVSAAAVTAAGTVAATTAHVVNASMSTAAKVPGSISRGVTAVAEPAQDLSAATASQASKLAGQAREAAEYSAGKAAGLAAAGLGGAGALAVRAKDVGFSGARGLMAGASDMTGKLTASVSSVGDAVRSGVTDLAGHMPSGEQVSTQAAQVMTAVVSGAAQFGDSIGDMVRSAGDTARHAPEQIVERISHSRIGTRGAILCVAIAAAAVLPSIVAHKGALGTSDPYKALRRRMRATPEIISKGCAPCLHVLRTAGTTQSARAACNLDAGVDVRAATKGLDQCVYSS